MQVQNPRDNPGGEGKEREGSARETQRRSHCKVPLLLYMTSRLESQDHMGMSEHQKIQN